MYIELEPVEVLGVVKQLVNELEIGDPRFLSRLQEASGVLSLLAYEMKTTVEKQEKVNA